MKTPTTEPQGVTRLHLSSSKIEREMAEEFDIITDLAEAKACLKIAYRQAVNMYHGRSIWMGIALLELLIIIGVLYVR